MSATTTETDLLYVEDNLADYMLVKRVFRKNELEGHLHRLPDGQAAIDFLTQLAASKQNKLPKLILLDIKLPGIDGLEVLKSVRNMSAYNRVPIVMLSTSDQESDIDTSYSNGANGFVIKPATYPELETNILSTYNFWIETNRQ